MREPKSMSPVAIETSSYLLLTFFSAVFFFCSIETVAASCFFHAFRVFSPFAACLGGKVPRHHKISLSTATLSRVSMCLCAWSLYTAIW